MATTGGQSGPGDAGSRPQKRRSKGRGITPVGESPWGNPTAPPDQQVQDLMARFGPAADAVLQFTAQAQQSIIAKLAEAEAAVNSFTQAAKLDLASGLTMPGAAVARVKTDAANSIRTKLARAAEYATAGTGQLATLADAQGYPYPPTPAISTHPDLPTVPRAPANPSPGWYPPNNPYPGATPNPPGSPANPTSYPATPGSIPPYPGGDPRGPIPWGISPTTSLVATTSGAPSGALAVGGRSMLNEVNQMCPPPVLPAGAIGWCVYGESRFGPGGFTPPPGAIHVKSGGWLVPDYKGDCELLGASPLNCPPISMLPTSPTTTTPTTTTPTPTVPPTTPTPPGTPPTKQPPGTPPICPPGSTAQWYPDWYGPGQGAWRCSASPTPIPTTPQPPNIDITVNVPQEPPPTINITEPPPTAGGCGYDRDHECWEASNPPDGKRHPFLTTPGVAYAMVAHPPASTDREVVQQANVLAGLDVQAEPQQLPPCDLPYQMSVVQGDVNVKDILINMLDTDEIRQRLADQPNLSGKIGMSYFSFLVATTWQIISQSLGAITDQIVKGAAFASPTLARIARREVVFRWMNVFCLGGLTKHARILNYVNGVEHPVGLPTPEAAAAGWLGNEIDDCQFQTYVMSGDQRFLEFKQITRAGKYKFTPLELMTLDRRGKLVRGDIRTRLRENGSLHQEDVTELNSLFTQVPGPAEIIRYMVRDVANQQVIQTFQLDAGFDANYNGQLKTWGEQQGLTPLQMSYEWMAHWSIPSPTQLYEILHRLRHDPKYGGPDKVQSDVETALRQQDILPYWIPRLMEISYHPVTRTDLNRAYDHGWIDDDAYRSGMWSNGYSDKDADTLLRFAKSERKLAIRSLEEIKLFAAGYMGQDQLQQAVTRLDYSPDLWPSILDEANYQRTIIQQRRIIDAIARQYKACRITLADATTAAESFEIPQEVYDIQFETAYENTVCATRHEFAATTGRAFSEGFLTADQYVQRMKELKFDDQAIQIYQSLLEKSKRDAAKKAQEKADAAAKKAELQAERESQRANQQAIAMNNRIARLAMQAERRRDARNDRLMKATSTLGQKLADVSEPPTALVTGLFNLLQSERGLNQDEASYVIGATASQAKGMTSQEYAAWVMQSALSALAEPWSLVPPEQPASGGL